MGRDILLGTLLGVFWVFVYGLGYLINIHLGERPQLATTELLEGTRAGISFWLGQVVGGILGVLIFFFVLVFLRVLVRNRWVAAALFVVLFSLPKILASTHPLVDAPVWIIIYIVTAFAVVHFGLIALAIATFTANVLLICRIHAIFPNGTGRRLFASS